MLQQTAAAKARSQDAKIDQSAQQFEAILVGTWLKDAEQSFATVPGADSDQDAGGQQMMSLGVQSLATALADSGGIGIGKMVAKAMHAAVERSKAGTGNAGTPHAEIDPSAASTAPSRLISTLHPAPEEKKESASP